MATSQDFVTWTCGPKLDQRYLLWVLRAERDDILRRTQGSTHKTIYMPDIEQLTIPLPTLDEQRRIVEYLEAETARVDALALKRLRMIALLDERMHSIRAEWWARWADQYGAVPLTNAARSADRTGLESAVRLIASRALGVGSAEDELGVGERVRAD